MKKHSIFLLVLFSIVLIAKTTFGAIIVGRITHVQGEMYRFMDVDQSWTETFVESPAGTHDIFSTGDNSRAEIVFPNKVLMRLDEHVEIDILEMAENTGIFALKTGLARFHNRNAAGSLEVETTMGTVRVGPGSAVDVMVNEKSVVVAAVHGEAIFESSTNGFEKLEVISGSTSLEFKEDTITAGTGPIDRKWDNWCTTRMNIWSQNRVAHSEYLPETMQEYAYTLEPYGNWRRIYYRGYYYWAWKPRHVAVGWAPYTTGYWYEWQGGPVWIDHNLWGWVTHHHGHWIHMQGAWMWTPYVHVAYVPGITVIGFNITFGKAFRPYWHPGRVRWLAHSSHIGWLPLAPWETYYGYRRWGPRSVAVHDGINFNITINLAKHRYLDHAVLIPRRHFHPKGPVTVNYNTVKIKNRSKKIIVKNYKPLPIMAKQKNRKHSTIASRAATTVNRIVRQPAGRVTNTRVSATTGKPARRQNTVKHVQRKGQQEKIIFRHKRTVAQKDPETTGRKRQITRRAGKIQNRRAGFGKRADTGKIESQEKSAAGSVIAAKGKSPKSTTVEKKNRKFTKSRQSAIQTSKNTHLGLKNKTIAGRQKKVEEKIQIKQKKYTAQRQGKQNKERGTKAQKETRNQYAENKQPDAAKKEQLIAGVHQFEPRQNTSWKQRGKKQKRGRGFFPASLSNRHLR